MVTSTSTPGSILMEVICLTISEGLCKSMSRLWILIWNRSQVLEPSPQGVFLVVILKVLVGMRTGPFTFRFFSLAPLIKSAQTFSSDFTLRLVSVIRIRWIATSGSFLSPGGARYGARPACSVLTHRCSLLLRNKSVRKPRLSHGI